MTFDYRKPFTTKSGRKCRLIADDILGNQPLAIAIQYEDKYGKIYENISCYTKEGRYCLDMVCESDLINVENKIEPFQYYFGHSVEVNAKEIMTKINEIIWLINNK